MIDRAHAHMVDIIADEKRRYVLRRVTREHRESIDAFADRVRAKVVEILTTTGMG